MPEGSPNRRRALTEEDIAAIVTAIENRSPDICSLNLDQEDVNFLKELVKAAKKARNIVGTVVITFVVLGILGLVTKGFWASLLEKH